MIKLATKNGERVGRDAASAATPEPLSGQGETDAAAEVFVGADNARAASSRASQGMAGFSPSKGAVAAQKPPIKPLAQEVFLSFEEELNHEQATLTFSEATRGVLVLGAVGSGKTSAVCLPALARAMQKGCAGLALDAKGEFCAWARSAQVPNAHRVLMLGPWEDCQPCNLIAGWSAQKVRGFLGWLASKVSASEGYWGSEGVVDGILAWEALKASRQEDPTLADLFWALSDPRGLCREIEAAHSEGAFDARAESRALWKRIQERSQGAYVFSLFHAGGLEGSIRSSSDSSETRQQYAWQTARILSALRKIAETPSLRAAFCAQQPLDWEDLWINQRAMVFLDCPQAIFGEACAMANSILRANFRDLVKSLSPARRRELGFGDTRFWLWICDEFQQLAREGGEGLSDDDSLWLDSSRAWGVINVLATQSISSLRAKLPQTADSLAQNCRALIALPSSDEATVARCAFLAGPQAGRVSEALTRPTRDVAFLHFHGGSRWAAGCVAPLRSGASDFMRERFDLDSDRARERGLLRDERPVSAWEKGEGLAPGEGFLSHVSEGAWQALRQEAAEALGPLQWIDDGSWEAATAREMGDSPAWAWDAAEAAAPRAENASSSAGSRAALGAIGQPERLIAALRRQEGLDWPARRLDARRARGGLAQASRDGVLLLGRTARAEGGVREWARSLGLSGVALGCLAATAQDTPRAMLGEPESEWAPELAQSVGLGAADVEEMAWRMGMWASALAAAKLGAVALEEAEREALSERSQAWLQEPSPPDGAQPRSAEGLSSSFSATASATPAVSTPLHSAKRRGVEFTLSEALGRDFGASRRARTQNADLEVGQIDMEDFEASREDGEESEPNGERERLAGGRALGDGDETPWMFDLDAEVRGASKTKEGSGKGVEGKSPFAAKRLPPAQAAGKGQNPRRQKGGGRKGVGMEHDESDEGHERDGRVANERADASSDASKEFFFKRSARMARPRNPVAVAVANPPLRGAGRGAAIKAPNQWSEWKTGPLQEASLAKSLVSEGFGWRWRAEAQETMASGANSADRPERTGLSADKAQEAQDGLRARAKEPERARTPDALSADAADWAVGMQSEDEEGFAREKQEKLAREMQWEMDAMGGAEGVHSNAGGWEALDPEGLLGAENATGWIEMDAWGRASERARSAKPAKGGAGAKKGAAGSVGSDASAAAGSSSNGPDAMQKGQGKTTSRDQDR